MKIIAVIGRTGCGKTTLSIRLSEKPALLIPHWAIIPYQKIQKGKYNSLIIDDAGLRSMDDWNVIAEIVHYGGRRYLKELWLIVHYFTQIRADIRSALTQLWIGRMDKNLIPQNYRNLEIPNEDFLFYGYGDDPRKVRLDIKRR